MTLNSLIGKTSRFMTDNSPVILTAIGATGVLATAYLTGKAALKTHTLIQHRRLDLAEEDVSYKLTDRDKFELVWKLYIPAAGSALLTIAAIICANHIGTRRAAAIATAYNISERAFSEYREKIIEKIGAVKEEKARTEIAQKKIDDNPASTNQVIVTGGGEVLCYESFTDRYFYSDLETLKKAMNDTNHQILRDSYASLSDFYERVGLKFTSISNDVGWNSDRLLDLVFSAVISEKGRPCIVVDYYIVPIHRYNQFN